MPSESSPAKDDIPTLISISALIFVLEDMLHEALGHGVTAWLSGARKITLSTVALQSDIATRPIDAAGTLVNLAAAAILWLILRKAQGFKAATRYFLVILLAGNLFGATGYFFFSGVTNFGDWAQVIRGLQPHWLWRTSLILLGVIGYSASMIIVGRELKPFLRRTNRLRLRRLCWTPYFAEGALATVAGLLNPAGLFYVIASAIPSTMGAHTGLFVFPFSLHPRDLPDNAPVGPIPRSVAWITAGAIAALFFILVLGRGLTWSR